LHFPVLGAVVLTGNLGGAIATLLLWGGLYLRDMRLRELIPLLSEVFVDWSSRILLYNSFPFVTFQLDGQEFIALNGGPVYQFSPAISLFVNCETQEEIDEFWEKLSEGGETVECGWLNDKYGISWQIVPTFVVEMLKAKDTDKTHRMLKALWQMQKLDIKRLKAAFDGRE
jgi:predicted 3-demethylubiquinone-9 3-methyltransferase (glyoxalase superfamily)